MTAAQSLTAESIVDVTATTTYVDVCSISAGSFTPNAKYLIIAMADLAGSASAGEHFARLRHGSTDFPDAEAAFDPGPGADGGFIFEWMYVFTQPSTPEAITLAIKGEGAGVATCKVATIFAINLDQVGVENTDWFYNEVTADYTTTTTPTPQAAITFTPNGTDVYMVIGHVSQGVPSVVADGNDFRVQLHDSVGGTTNPSYDIEGEDIDAGDECRPMNLMRVFTPTNASHTFSVRPFHAGASFTVLSSRIFALKLNKFAQFFHAYTDGAVSPATSPTWTNVATLNFTPSVTGNWFYYGHGTIDPAGATDEVNVRLQDDNDGSMGSDPNYGDDAPNAAAYDPTDDLPASLMKLKSLTSGVNTTINFDATRVVGSADVKHRSIVAFSLELAGAAPAGNPYYAYAQQ